MYTWIMRQYKCENPKKVLAALAGQADGFYLVGGTALSLYYFEHRESYDVDLFTKDLSINRL